MRKSVHGSRDEEGVKDNAGKYSGANNEINSGAGTGEESDIGILRELGCR